MKLLLDENLPQQLRHVIPGHDCVTVGYLGWAGIDNGRLLALAAAEGVDALLTNDSNLEYEQNLSNLPIAVVVIHAPSNDIDDIRPLIPVLLCALPNLPPKQVSHIR